MAKINGRIFRIFTDAEGGTPAAVDCETGVTFTVNGSEIDVTCKDDGVWGDFLVGQKSIDITIDSVLNDEGDNGFFEYIDHIEVDDTLDYELQQYVDGSPVVGSKKISGKAIILSTSISSVNNEGVTWNATLRGRGAPTVTTITS